MTDEPQNDAPEVDDPRQLEEKGVTIPVPTPTATTVENPWKREESVSPSDNGGDPADAAPEGGPGPEQPTAEQSE